MKFEGGGGTDFDVAVGAFTNKVVNRIVFTDGYAPMPKKPVRAIWVVIGDTEIHPEGGKVIYLNRHEFDKKYDKYFGNIAANEEAYQTLLKKKSKYAVRNDKSLRADINGVNQSISECYWITTKDNKGVVFYQK